MTEKIHYLDDGTDPVNPDTTVTFGETVSTDNFEGVLERIEGIRGRIKHLDGNNATSDNIRKIKVFGGFIVGKTVQGGNAVYDSAAEKSTLTDGEVTGHGTVEVGNRTLEYLIVGDTVIVQNIETGEMARGKSVAIDGYKVTARLNSFTVEPRRPIA
jgi:hypothetical protein